MTRKKQEKKQEEIIIEPSWINSFLSRHEDLKKRTPRKLEEERIQNSDDFIITTWFDKIITKFNENNYHPSLIANMDETMLSSKDLRIKVIIPQERKTGVQRMQKETEHITLVVTCFADNTLAKTGVILPLQNLPYNLEDISDTFAWGGTSNGWITRPLFKDWAFKIFIPEIIRRREQLNNTNLPAILFIDAHDSREDTETLKYLKEIKIDVVTFPSHTTHILQPLDAGFFASFKRTLTNLKRHQLKGMKGGKRRKKLLLVTKEALYVASYPEKLRSSWIKTGLYPLNKSKILENELVTPSVNEETIVAPKPKKKRISISNSFITDDEVIQQIEAREREKKEKEAQKGTKKRGRPKKITPSDGKEQENEEKNEDEK